jgi:hypothetical protein
VARLPKALSDQRITLIAKGHRLTRGFSEKRAANLYEGQCVKCKSWAFARYATAERRNAMPEFYGALVESNAACPGRSTSPLSRPSLSPLERRERALARYRASLPTLGHRPFWATHASGATEARCERCALQLYVSPNGHVSGPLGGNALPCPGHLMSLPEGVDGNGD